MAKKIKNRQKSGEKEESPKIKNPGRQEDDDHYNEYSQESYRAQESVLNRQHQRQYQGSPSYDNFAYEISSPYYNNPHEDENHASRLHNHNDVRDRRLVQNSTQDDGQYDQIAPVHYSNQIDDDDDEGPTLKKRKCRDIICLGFLSVAIIIMLAIGGYAIAKGSINRLIYMTDSSNCDQCGIKNKPIRGIPNSGQDKSEFPYVIFLKRDGSYDKSFHYFLPDERLEYITQCRTSCPLEFKAVANRCISKEFRWKTPKQSGIIESVTSFFSQVAADFESSWEEIVWMCVIALGLALLMSVFLRLFAGIIIWVVVTSVSLAAVLGSSAVWILWLTYKNDLNSGKEDAPSQSEVNGLLIGAIVASVLTVLLLLVLLFMRKRFALVIKLFQEAGKAVHAMPLLLLQPLLTFISLAIALSGWLIMLMLIESAGNEEMISIGDSEACIYKKSAFLLFSRWWNLFMVFWITQLIVDCQHMIIAGAVSKWFFTRNKNKLGFPILVSWKRLISYHLGSIAFGSLIIAIVKIIRFTLKTIENRLGANNAICKGLLYTCKCCIWCLEKFLIFLNRNAYIEIAIYGYGFCKSAQKAFKVLVDNAFRVAAINSIGDFVLVLAKLIIVATTVLIGYQFTRNNEDITLLWVPLTIGGFCSYLIAHCFISVYQMAIDTVFICFCEDCALNDGQAKPFYMSKGLMEFVKRNAKTMKNGKEKRRATKKSEKYNNEL